MAWAGNSGGHVLQETGCAACRLSLCWHLFRVMTDPNMAWACGVPPSGVMPVCGCGLGTAQPRARRNGQLSDTGAQQPPTTPTSSMTTLDLFPSAPGTREAIGPAAYVLRGYALPDVQTWLDAIDRIAAQAPFRHMVTPGGYTMSVAMTNCGAWGWAADRRGYRYVDADPLNAQPWPAMPVAFATLAAQAAAEAGFADYVPDAGLINRYVPGTRLSLHQDRDERDLGAPIVSVSLGMSAVFLFGGHARGDKAARVALHHGDVVVWGGEDRLRFHGVMPLKDEPHPLLGSQRLNITLRKAG